MEPNGDASKNVNGLGDDVRAAAAAALAERTLTGDLRDSLLGLFRDEKNPWHLMSEERQTRLAHIIEEHCEILVRRAISIIAARDFPAVGVALDQVAFKPKGIEAKMTFGIMEAKTRHALVDAQGGRIVIVMADPDFFRGSRGIARVDRQEPELPLDTKPNGHDPEPVPDAGEGRDLGEINTGDADAAAGAQNNPALGYTLGYADGRSGRPMLDGPFPEGSPERARYEAGWLQSQIDGLKHNPSQQQTATAGAAHHFREMGRVAFFRSRKMLTDCPLADWMPATKWWREGLLEAICGAAAEAGKAGVDRAENPYPEDTPEGEAWLSAWTAPEPGAGHPPAEEPKRRGRPRKGSEPPADHPVA